MSLIRARLLTDICFDMSYHPKTEWIELDAIRGMFDICDVFETEFGSRVQTDPEIRACYGQILDRTSNVAARVVNPNIPSRSDPSLRPALGEDMEMGESFSSAAEEDAKPPDAFTPASDELIAAVVDRLPALEDRAKPFLFIEGTFEEREPFVQCICDILGSRYFVKRHEKDEDGGYWPEELTEAEKTKLKVFRDGLDGKIGPLSTIEDIAVICSLLVGTSYAEWQSADGIYKRAAGYIAEELVRFESISPIHASRILRYIGNFLVHPSRELENSDLAEAIGEVALADRIFFATASKVEIEALSDEKGAQKYFDSAFDVLARRSNEILHGKVELAGAIVDVLLDQIEGCPTSLKITEDILLGVTLQLLLGAGLIRPPSLAQDTRRIRFRQVVEGLIDRGRISGEEFRRPQAGATLGLLVPIWIMRREASVTHLDDLRIAALIDLLERRVGVSARKSILASAAETDSEAWRTQPIGPLADYAAMLRDRDGPRGELSIATLSLWAQHLLAGNVERVLQEVEAELGRTSIDVRAMALESEMLAFRGIVLLASGFVTTRRLLDAFCERIQGYAPAGRACAAALYRDGIKMSEASRIVSERDEALGAALASLASLDVLDGGGPRKWTAMGDIRMTDKFVEALDAAVAGALLDKIKASSSLEAATVELERLRHVSARGQSRYLRQALTYLVGVAREGSAEQRTLLADLASLPAEAPTLKTHSARVGQLVAVPDEVPGPDPALFRSGKSGDWPVAPLFAGAWRNNDAEDLVSAVGRALACFPTVLSTENVHAVLSGRSTPLAHYPGFEAVEILIEGKDGTLSTFVSVHGVSQALLINGASLGLHQLNAGGPDLASPLALESEDQARSYLSFFCGCVNGEEGPFVVVETAEQLLDRWSGAALPEDIVEKIRPMSMAAGPARTKGQDEGTIVVDGKVKPETDSGERALPAWEAEAVVLYGDGLFQSSFAIWPNGMIEMLDDDPLETDLPVQRDGFLQGLRIAQFNDRL
jgi:hypothetical protein